MLSSEHTVVLVGTGVWVLILIAMLAQWPQLSADGRTWWIVAPLTGIALGLFGLRGTIRRAREGTQETSSDA